MDKPTEEINNKIREEAERLWHLPEAPKGAIIQSLIISLFSMYQMGHRAGVEYATDFDRLKPVLWGEFYIDVEHECTACGYCHTSEPEECEVCGGDVRYTQRHQVDWPTIKDILKAAVDPYLSKEGEAG